MPLHIIDASGILNSFDTRDVPEAGSRESLMSTDFRLAAGADGGVLAARLTEYVIEAWSQEGVRLGGLRGSPDLNAGSSPLQPPSADNPLPSASLQIRIDASGRLWVSFITPRPGWMDYLDPSGDLGDTPRDAFTGIYQGRLDVIDLATCTMVASQQLDQMLLLLDDETVLGYGFTELGANTLDVLRVELKP